MKAHHLVVIAAVLTVTASVNAQTKLPMTNVSNAWKLHTHGKAKITYGGVTYEAEDEDPQDDQNGQSQWLTGSAVGNHPVGSNATKVNPTRGDAHYAKASPVVFVDLQWAQGSSPTQPKIIAEGHYYNRCKNEASPPQTETSEAWSWATGIDASHFKLANPSGVTGNNVVLAGNMHLQADKDGAGGAPPDADGTFVYAQIGGSWVMGVWDNENEEWTLTGYVESGTPYNVDETVSGWEFEGDWGVSVVIPKTEEIVCGSMANYSLDGESMYTNNPSYGTDKIESYYYKGDVTFYMYQAP